MVHRHHESIAAPGEIPVPHGPPDSDDPDEFPGLTNDERRIFSHVTRPDDSYNEDGVYWADLPLAKRVGFVTKVDNQAAREEASSAWTMFKEDPLSNLSWYFRHAVIPGAGLGLEGYVLFSIGNLEPLFKAAWPDCWSDDHTTCSKNWIASVTYLEIIGIMVGQAFVGVSLIPPYSLPCLASGHRLGFPTGLPRARFPFWAILASSGCFHSSNAKIKPRRSLVIGLVDDGVSFRMPPSCSSVFSCSLPLGA